MNHYSRWGVETRRSGYAFYDHPQGEGCHICGGAPAVPEPLTHEPVQEPAEDPLDTVEMRAFDRLLDAFYGDSEEG